MLVFVDTEFSGLGQRWPRLISIGLVCEDNREFYSELPADTYITKVDDWVRKNVLRLLDGGAAVMQPDELRQHLTAWISTLADAVIAIDSETDLAFLRAMLDPWPTNVDPKPLMLLGLDHADAFNEAVERAFAGGLRRHHALDDAKANRLGWLAVRVTQRD
jgi:hypothetical protein